VDAVKEVVSVSLGSAKRDHAVEIDLLGERFRIRRVGTDGSLERAARTFAELDGAVDALGMGGIDIYLPVDGRRYYFRDAKKLVKDVRTTPVVCGSGLKRSVERSVVDFMTAELGLELAGKRCLMTTAVDRWGMAEGLKDAGCEMAYGDLVYGLGLPVPIRTWTQVRVLARVLMPVVTRLPFKMLYPTGSEQEKQAESNRTAERLNAWADIIAGDFNYIRKYMPEDMTGKWVISNTTTAEDVAELTRRGAELLVTSTPRLDGRSFGTNVIEATMIALVGATDELEQAEYQRLLEQVGFKPDAMWLQDEVRPEQREHGTGDPADRDETPDDENAELRRVAAATAGAASGEATATTEQAETPSSPESRISARA
jgi:hypothetical protein